MIVYEMKYADLRIRCWDWIEYEILRINWVWYAKIGLNMYDILRINWVWDGKIRLNMIFLE